jgi:hypothetical protein
MTEHHFDLSSLEEEERNKSLQELDGQDWGDGSFFPSHLVLTCHALRRKPLRDFTIEDLRIMIGQNFSLEYLVPLAIEHLQRDPFAAGDFYEGDLLASVLRVQSGFWQQRPDLRQAVEAIIAPIPAFPKILRQALSIFQQR